VGILKGVYKMVFREAFETQDVRRMCKHAERGHETKKLMALIDRLNRKMAEQKISGNLTGASKPPATVLVNAGIPRHLGGLSILER
jgi:hypothetical protein